MSKNIFEKLVSGDLGLSKTFWIYGFAIGLIFNMLSGIVFFTISIKSYIAMMVLYNAYIISVLIGIWKASNKYNGKKIWSILAKTYIVINILVLLTIVISIFLINNANA